VTISIATWNVNSVRTRITHLREWLAEDKPDIVLLQEIKCIDEQFPRMEIEELGYNIETFGQKSYNGVAILSKFPLEDVSRGLPGDDSDVASRYIEAVANTPIGVFRAASVYVPNGQEMGSEKCAYKFAFLERLYAHAAKLRGHDEMLVIGGDYNIAPTDADVANPKDWAGSVLTHDTLRAALKKIMNLGLYDAGANEHAFTWWDYRAGGYEKNDGLRIDHLLMSPQAMDKFQSCHVAVKLRALEKPSDHAPVVGVFS
jgi:exodeoxyribonuclease-3